MTETSKILDLHILERFVKDNNSGEFIKNLESYKESIKYLKIDDLPIDDFKYFQIIKTEMEEFFFEHGLQKKIDEINKSNLKTLDAKILNKIQIFEDKTEEELIQKVKDFLHEIIKDTGKKIDPNYGAIRTIVDGFKIQISYRFVD